MKRAALIVGASIALIGAGAAVGIGVALRYPDRAAGTSTQRVKLTVARGTAFGEIAMRLAEAGVITRPSWFRFYANEQGLASKVRAGQYELDAGMTPRAILHKLVEGAPAEEVTVTIPEGKNILEIAELLDAAGVTPRAGALKLMRDPAFLKQHGITGETIEGYLFPDTYRFRPGSDPHKVLSHLVKRSKEMLADVKKQYPKAADKLARDFGFGDRELVIMASLVEKETAAEEERPRIAGVFYNRLRLKTFVPHLLQTDPTIVYGCTVPEKKSAACQRFEGRIRRIHLDDKENPYSTYAHEGLPPGPISNPGRAALEAALQPDATPYLYFVSKNDGTHYFSKTVKEHEAAVVKYQKNGT